MSSGAWNEIVVDGRGSAYINGGTGIIALVGPDGPARQVADGIQFPNGMAVTPDNSTLVMWADLAGGVPDGICIDEDNAVWYGDVPNKRCVRVREGGEVLLTAEWRGMEKIPEVARARTGQILTIEAPAPGVGWP